MATALDLIKSSLRLVGVLASGEEPSSEESADALLILNDLIDSLSTERLTVFEISRDSHTLTASTNPHTIGSSGGNITAARPIRIEEAGIIEAGQTVEYPLEIVGPRQWAEVADKSIASEIPSKLWYEPEFPLGKIHLYPVPSAAQTLVLYTWKALSSLAALATELSLPPGYARMLRYNLAVDLAPEYGRTVKPEVSAIARESKVAIQIVNVTPEEMRCDPGVTSRGSGYDVRADI